jgi:hypothetical protein
MSRGRGTKNQTMEKADTLAQVRKELTRERERVKDLTRQLNQQRESPKGLEGYPGNSQVVGEPPKAKSTPWIIDNALPMLTVLGLALYAIVRNGHNAFYGALGISPEDVGLTYGVTVGRAATGLVVVLCALIPISTLYFIPLAQKWTKAETVIYPFLALLNASAAIVLLYVFFPEWFLGRYMDLPWYVRRVLWAIPIVGVIGYRARQEIKKRDAPQGRTKASPKSTGAKGVAQTSRNISWAMLLIGVLSSGILFAFLSSQNTGHQLADAVKHGKEVRPYSGLGVIGLRADRVRIHWLNPKSPPFTPPANVLYLGQANGILVLYLIDDPVKGVGRVAYVPAGSTSLEQVGP